jgi:hypothetical protein
MEAETDISNKITAGLANKLDINPMRLNDLNLPLDSRDKFIDEESESTRRPLKIGDIVYFQFDTEFDKMGDLKEKEGYFRGFLGGDGLAVNSLTCYIKEITQYKTLSRFLFEITVPESGSYKRKKESKKDENNKLEDQMKPNQNMLIDADQKEENILDQKETQKGTVTQQMEELNKQEVGLKNLFTIDSHLNQTVLKKVKKNYQKKKLQKGDAVVYGMKIALKHVYSEGYLSVNKYKLSNEKDSVNVSILNKNNKDCQIKLFDPSNTRKPGEPVKSLDTVSLEFSSAGYNLKINENSTKKTKLEINAGNELCMFKIMPFTRSISFLNMAMNILKNGDIIKLFNKDTDKYLAGKYNILNFKKKSRKVFFVDGDCEKYLNGDSEFEVDVLTKKKLQDPNYKNEIMVYPEQKGKNILSCMWEVRRPGTIQSKSIGNSNKESDAIYLKHVMTGEFLYCEDGEKLTLKNFHSVKNKEGFSFFLKMKNNWTSDNSIK